MSFGCVVFVCIWVAQLWSFTLMKKALRQMTKYLETTSTQEVSQSLKLEM